MARPAKPSDPAPPAKRPDSDAWWGPTAGPLPTPNTMLRAHYLRLLLTCQACHHQTDADLQALVDSGRGDVTLIKLRWRCSRCGHRKIDAVVMAKKTGPR